MILVCTVQLFCICLCVYVSFLQTVSEGERVGGAIVSLNQFAFCTSLVQNYDGSLKSFKGRFLWSVVSLISKFQMFSSVYLLCSIRLRGGGCKVPIRRVSPTTEFLEFERNKRFPCSCLIVQTVHFYNAQPRAGLTSSYSKEFWIKPASFRICRQKDLQLQLDRLIQNWQLQAGQKAFLFRLDQ